MQAQLCPRVSQWLPWDLVSLNWSTPIFSRYQAFQAAKEHVTLPMKTDLSPHTYLQKAHSFYSDILWWSITWVIFFYIQICLLNRSNRCLNADGCPQILSCSLNLSLVIPGLYKTTLLFHVPFCYWIFKQKVKFIRNILIFFVPLLKHLQLWFHSLKCVVKKQQQQQGFCNKIPWYAHAVFNYWYVHHNVSQTFWFSTSCFLRKRDNLLLQPFWMQV